MSPSSGETSVVERVDLDVDLDKVVPCQAVDNTPYFFGGRGEELGCEVPAEWVRTYPCCGGTADLLPGTHGEDPRVLRAAGADTRKVRLLRGHDDARKLEKAVSADTFAPRRQVGALATGGSGSLALTGVDLVWVLLAAFALVAAGTALLRIVPRREA